MNKKVNYIIKLLSEFFSTFKENEIELYSDGSGGVYDLNGNVLFEFYNFNELFDFLLISIMRNKQNIT